jgi:serine/threonine-protein kinase SRPK3
MKMVRDSGEVHHLPVLIDTFIIDLNNGEQHRCFILELLGSDVATLRGSAPQKALPVHVVKSIIIQVLTAVVQLHRLGIVHTGTCDGSSNRIQVQECADIKPDNMLFRMDKTTEQIKQWLSEEVLVDDESHPFPLDFTLDTNAKSAKRMHITLIDLGQGTYSFISYSSLC